MKNAKKNKQAANNPAVYPWQIISEIMSPHDRTRYFIVKDNQTNIPFKLTSQQIYSDLDLLSMFSPADIRNIVYSATVEQMREIH